MEWFKHKTNAHDDPVVSAAMDEYGDAAYVVWFILLELYGQQYNSQKPDAPLVTSKVYLARKFRKRWTKVALILNYYATFDKLSISEGEKQVSIQIGNFTKILSNWTKRKVDRPTEVPTEVPTAETRLELEEIRELSTDGAIAPPTEQEKLKEIQAERLKQSIDEITEKLYKGNRFPDVYAFRGKMWKQGKNDRAILHTLEAVLRKRDFNGGNPFAYAVAIMNKENGNYNEADHTEEAARQKRELEEYCRSQEGGA